MSSFSIRVFPAVFLLLVIFCCQTNTTNTNDLQDKSLVYRYYFENKSDTIRLGDETDIIIKIEQYRHDSLSLILGTLNEQNKLIDTTGVIEVKDSIAFFAIIPMKLGDGTLEGIIQDMKIETDKTIIGSVPLRISYYVIDSN